MVVVYKADVSNSDTRAVINLGAVEVNVVEGFLSDIDSLEVRTRIEAKINNNEMLTEQELMQLIILPLTYKGIDKQKESIRQTTELIKRMNEEQKGFALVGLLSFTDKIIDDDVSADIRRILTMTKVGRMIAEEWDEKLRINTQEVTRKVTDQVTKKVTNQVTERVTNQVTEQDISILVRFCKRMGGAVTDLIESLMQDYNLDEKEAMKKIEMYW